MKIEILFVADCPGYSPTLKAVELLAAEERVSATIVSTEMIDPDVQGFPGSPTVRIDGVDIEPGVFPIALGLSCRTYLVDGKLQNVPPPEMIRAAIRRAASRAG
jgi:hypothetical protein